MRKLFAASVKMTYRNRQGLFWSLAFPIIFVVVFGLFNFEETPTAKVRVVVEQPSAVSAGLVAGLRSVEPFDVSESASLSEAKDDLESGTSTSSSSRRPASAPASRSRPSTAARTRS